ncbi:phosphotransferase [Streptomyces sp. NPDC024017]|uniref:phosphotransferase n=1 Tax=Streptomyces sp. NPDC024017 TaxID=3154326 RepID=UPI00340260CB
MTTARRTLTRADLAPLTRAALGPSRTLTGVERLRGGTKKGVYRLTLDDDSTAIAYVWSADEDYWDQPDPDPRDVFSHGTGLGLFTAAHDRLVAAGVRTPRLLHADSTHTHLPADAAVVEDMTGGSLEEALARDPEGAPEAMERMAELLATLHSRTGPRFGKVAVVDQGGSSHGVSCEQRITEGALRCIAEAAARDPRAAAARRELEEEIHTLAAEVRLRFGPHYDALRAPGLDEARLRLYRLSMHIGLVSGPLTLIEGDFPHPGRMRDSAEHNLHQALSLLKSAS